MFRASSSLGSSASLTVTSPGITMHVVAPLQCSYSLSTQMLAFPLHVVLFVTGDLNRGYLHSEGFASCGFHIGLGLVCPPVRAADRNCFCAEHPFL